MLPYLRDLQVEVCISSRTPLREFSPIGRRRSTQTVGRHFLRNFDGVSATLAVRVCRHRVVRRDCRHLLSIFFLLRD